MLRYLPWLLILVSVSFAYRPGLRVPGWYRGEVILKTPPKIRQPFELKFEFQPLSVELPWVELELELPPGVEVLEGQPKSRETSLSAGKTLVKNWLLKINSNADGLSLGVGVKTATPIQELKAEAEKIYAEESQHQRVQLLEYIENLNSVSNLHFNQLLFCYPTESFFKAPSLVYKNLYTSSKLKGGFLYFHYKDTQDTKLVVRKIEENERYLQQIKADPEKFVKFLKDHRSHYNRLKEDLFYLYYSLSLHMIENKEYKKAEEHLQKLSSILLAEESMSYDLFLAIQNLRALVEIQDGVFKKARKILSSSIQTATNATTRHYLMYNLALVYEAEGNKPQAGSYLLEALKESPGLSIAQEAQQRIK